LKAVKPKAKAAAKPKAKTPAAVKPKARTAVAPKKQPHTGKLAVKGKGKAAPEPNAGASIRPAAQPAKSAGASRSAGKGHAAPAAAGNAAPTPMPPPSRRRPKPGSPDWPGENLTVGMEAPEFSLPSTGGQRVTMSEFRGKRVVLYFYPKDDTPGCTMEACAFRDNMARIEGKDAVLLGISLDDELSHQRFAQKYNLPFPLLSDIDAAISRRYGTYKEKSLYGRTFWGIERTTFVIDRDGKVENVFRRVKVEGHAEEVLATLSV
jgi:peroxiredoxin Q/BCP